MDRMISVIIPVFGVAQFIERCIHSLMKQSYEHVEYILVDDKSPDSSMQKALAVVDCYPNRKENVRVICHAENKGLPSARNTGLIHARGYYIFHCDSDDYLAVNALEEMIKLGLSEQADIVYTDFYLSFESRERYMVQPDFSSPEDCLRGMLNGSMKFNVWNKLIRRSLYEANDIWFPDGKGMGEDMTMIRLFCHALKVAYLPKACYHYVQGNSSAFTKRFSNRHIEEILFNTDQTISYIQKCFGNDFEQDLHFFKLNMKLPFLISTDQAMYRIWQSLFKESNPYIRKNFSFSLRIKFIQLAALRRQYWIVKMYNILVVRFIYGIIYK